jgi:heptaprenyl diphosphate synthase
MSPSIPLARRGTSVAAHASLTERLFASSDDRRMARSIDDGLALVEEQLLREVRFADDVADVTTRYLLDAGGKRVRPMLALLIAQLDAAVAIEITHLASLYHDDVMDEADMRRGVPSAQAVWGNSVAILAGDLLFARASRIVADLGPRAIRLQAATFERLVLGQLHETIGPREGQDPIEHYLDVLADKTGSLIACAAQMGVIYSGADPELEAAVLAFGERTGVAFQLVDDVLDLADQPEETGKLAGTDLRAGVSTLPLLYLTRLAATDRDAAALLARIQRDVEHEETPESEADLTAAIAELRDHEVTARTIAEAHRWAAEAVEALAPLPEGPVKKALTRFTDTIVERTR